MTSWDICAASGGLSVATSEAHLRSRTEHGHVLGPWGCRIWGYHASFLCHSYMVFYLDKRNINYTKTVHQDTVKKLIHQPERLGQSIVVPILTILKWRRRVKSLEALEFIQIYGCQNPIISLSHSDSLLVDFRDISPVWLANHSSSPVLYPKSTGFSSFLPVKYPYFWGTPHFQTPSGSNPLHTNGPPAWHSDLLGNPRVAGYPPHPAIYSMGPMCEIITWVKWSGHQGSMGCK